LTDANGATQTQYTYSAFGQSTTTGAENNNSAQYTGRENDGTGLQYNRARYYSSTLQRFISEDPLGFGGGDINLYVYARNNPLMFTDPFGEATLQIRLGGTVIYGIGAATGSFGIAIDTSGNVGWYWDNTSGLKRFRASHTFCERW
jgi:RHS repeat-associated protein